MKRVLLTALLLLALGGGEAQGQTPFAKAAYVSPAAQLTLSQARARAMVQEQEPRMTIRGCHRLSPRHVRCLVNVPVYGKYEIYDERTGVVSSVEEIEVDSVLLTADVGLKGVKWRFPGTT